MGRPRKIKEAEAAVPDLLSEMTAGTPTRPSVPTSQPAAVAEASALPAVLQYTPLATTERWQVERFEEMAAELGWAAQDGSWERQMVELHELGMQYSRSWLICRRLFGIGPVILPVDADPSDFEAKGRAEVAEMLGIEVGDVQAELDALRALWRDHCQRELAPKQAEEAVQAEATAAAQAQVDKGELKFGEEVLLEFGFEESMFEIAVMDPQTKKEVPRKQAANRAERDWFCKRMGEWAKMLREPMAGAVAREALMNELYLRRFGQAMAGLNPSSERWEDLYRSKKQLEGQLSTQLDKLQEMFPEMAIAQKTSFRAVLSDLVRAYQEYYGRKDRRLVDKIFTATEVEVMVRQSLQAPEPRYRFGLNMALVEAMHGLYDPNWRPQFKPSVLKKMDAGFKAGVAAMREALKEPLIDLQKGVMPGEGEDFPDLKDPEGEEKAKG